MLSPTSFFMTEAAAERQGQPVHLYIIHYNTGALLGRVENFRIRERVFDDCPRSSLNVAQNVVQIVRKCTNYDAAGARNSDCRRREGPWLPRARQRWLR